VLHGGFGSAICEALVDEDVRMPVLRLGLPDRYFFENGGRNHVLEKYGLGVLRLAERICRFAQKASSSADAAASERETAITH